MNNLASVLIDNSGAKVVTGCFGRHSFPVHSHTDFAVCTVERGRQGFSTKKTKDVLHKGCFAAVNPYELHDGYNTDEIGWYQHVLFFTPAHAKNFSDENMLKGHEFLFGRNTSENELLAEIFTQKVSAISETSDSLKRQCLFEEAMAMLHHKEGILSLQKYTPKFATVKRAVEMMNDTPEERHSLDELADAAGLSKFHFLRSFKEHTGTTPHAYLNLLRMNKAFDLLTRTDTPLSDIAAECGYCDQPHFVRSFKKMWGTTPASIKRK